jgi:phenolic acid decarboxylase
MVELKARREELAGILGKRIVYVYENGWMYELYVKNEHVIDYRIHSGIVGGRWVRDQEVSIAHLGHGIYKISWTEPTGTDVSLSINIEARRTHGTAYFPRWIELDPAKTVCYQNEHLELMHKYRDEGPTYPKMAVDEFSSICYVEDCGVDNESVITCAPSEIPAEDPMMAALRSLLK